MADDQPRGVIRKNGRVVEVQKGGETVSEPVDREAVSQESKDAYRNASTVEEKVDALFHIVTGERP